MVEFVLLRTVEFVLLRMNGVCAASNEWTVEVLRWRSYGGGEREPSIDHVLPVIGCMCLHTLASRFDSGGASVSRFIMNGKFKVSALKPSGLITM
jgi:hypothetical protein